MKHIENTSIYTADEGCFIVRKADNFIMGPSIDLGSADSIDNYEDKDFTEEEMKAFYESVGMEYKVNEAKEDKAESSDSEEMIEVQEHNNDMEDVKDED